MTGAAGAFLDVLGLAPELPTPYGALSVRQDEEDAVLASDGRGREFEILRVEAGKASPDGALSAPADAKVSGLPPLERALPRSALKDELFTVS